MRVVHVSGEVAPLSQTGGLGDVAGAIGGALMQVKAGAAGAAPGAGGVEAAVFSPLYRGVRERAAAHGATVDPTGVWAGADLAGRSYWGQVHAVRLADSAAVYLIDCPELYDRDGLYGHFDDPVRFAFLCRAAIDTAPKVMGGPPDVWHAHDWQAALVPVYLRLGGGRGACVFTIHNLAYQGIYDKHVVPILGLDWSVFSPDRMELHDRLSLLKGGIAYADAVTTVSPTYAQEILEPAFGFGLDGFLRAHAANLTGILNGIDTASWDPATDRAIAARYDAARWDATDGKRACRGALLAEMGLWAAPEEIVLGVVSRFAYQKGMDLVAQMVPELYRLGARLVVLGSGDWDIEERFRHLGQRYRDHVAVRIGFDAGMSRRIYAGADAMLIPSRFEPCGLTQLYAMRYGTVPIAHAVGGLRDTVVDTGDEAMARGEGTGFRFEHATADGLLWAIGRAAAMFRHDRKGFGRLARAGMALDLSWDASAAHYLALYARIAQPG